MIEREWEGGREENDRESIGRRRVRIRRIRRRKRRMIRKMKKGE